MGGLVPRDLVTVESCLRRKDGLRLDWNLARYLSTDIVFPAEAGFQSVPRYANVPGARVRGFLPPQERRVAGGGHHGRQPGSGQLEGGEHRILVGAWYPLTCQPLHLPLPPLGTPDPLRRLVRRRTRRQLKPLPRQHLINRPQLYLRVVLLP